MIKVLEEFYFRSAVKGEYFSLNSFTFYSSFSLESDLNCMNIATNEADVTAITAIEQIIDMCDTL
jgi:hypothetical protein